MVDKDSGKVTDKGNDKEKERDSMQQKESRKILLIGMDGLMPEQIDRYKDDIPEPKAFLERGFFSPAQAKGRIVREALGTVRQA